MEFYEWMQQQIERDDPVGDLARDMETDVRLNDIDPTGKSWGFWRSRIKAITPDVEVIHALYDAFDEWQQEVIQGEVQPTGDHNE